MKVLHRGTSEGGNCGALPLSYIRPKTDGRIRTCDLLREREVTAPYTTGAKKLRKTFNAS
jgi:hypothetical protein